MHAQASIKCGTYSERAPSDDVTVVGDTSGAGDGIEALTKRLRCMPLFNKGLGHNPSLKKCAEHLGICPGLLEGCLPTLIVDGALVGQRTVTRAVRLLKLLPVLEGSPGTPLRPHSAGASKGDLPKLKPFQQDVLDRRLDLHRPATLKAGDETTSSDKGDGLRTNPTSCRTTPIVVQGCLKTKMCTGRSEGGFLVVPVALEKVGPRTPKALQVNQGGSVLGFLKS